MIRTAIRLLLLGMILVGSSSGGAAFAAPDLPPVPVPYSQEDLPFIDQARHGIASAQCWVAFNLLMGLDLPDDPKTAVLWYKVAAESGSAFAANALGEIYASSPYRDMINPAAKVIPANELEALKWYRLAAEKGYPPAQHSLASILYYGRGVAVDHKEALAWNQKAAQQGYSPAQASLSSEYEESCGDMPVDPVEAYVWGTLAKEGDENSTILVNYLQKQLSPDQFAKANQRIAELRKAFPGGKSFSEMPLPWEEKKEK
ncbi:MAG: sel1 repeat family protein [Candidatus Riflebacteria bacterium]|nr:sel1 repeat family protein [Candidatus Riflebacteria bacterium]